MAQDPKTNPREGPVRLWALTDGRAGNRAQALGLAEALARRLPAEIAERRIALKPWAAAMPPRLWHALGARPGGWPVSGLAAGAEALAPPWPDLVIGAGRRAAPVAAALRRLYAVPAVQLLAPRMALEAFDLVVAPAHDGLGGANLLASTGAIGRLTPERIAAAAEPWRDRLGALPRPRVAVLIGGPSGAARFGRRDARRLSEALAALAPDHGLMITLSRRSPAGLGAAIRRATGEGAFLWEGGGEGGAANPYPGILGLADAVLVTADSVNMASEAATSGKPVHVFALTRIAAKLRRFHRQLEAAGAARPFTGRIERWSYPPLAEADRVAGAILERGLIAGPGTPDRRQFSL